MRNMKINKIAFIATLLLLSIAVNGKPATQQETIKGLEEKNELLRKELDDVSGKVDLLTDRIEFIQTKYDTIDAHNWEYIKNYYDRISLLLTILGFFIAVFSVGVPILINRSHDKLMQKQIESASNDAKEAKGYLSQVNTLKKEIDNIKTDIQNDRKASADAAKRAKVSELISQANQEKNPNMSIKLLDKALKLNPNIEIALINRGIAKSKLGDKKGAIADYNKAIELKSNDAIAYNYRGNAKSDIGEKAEAIKDYNKAVELKPNFALAFYNRGNAKSAIGDKEGAIRDYDKAIGMKPECISPFIDTEDNESDFDINEYFNRWVDVELDYSIAYNNRGVAKSSLGDKEGAIKDYDKAIELRPDYAKAYYNRGNAKSSLEDKDSAIKDYSRAIELNPNYASAYNNRGIAKSSLGDKDGAIRDYDKAIELKPDCARYYINRASLYRKMAKQEEDETQKAELINLAKKDEAISKELNSQE